MYDELDYQIVCVIRVGGSPLYNFRVVSEADRISNLTGREGFRIIDGRLQALRKAGRIAYANRTWTATQQQEG